MSWFRFHLYTLVSRIVSQSIDLSFAKILTTYSILILSVKGNPIFERFVNFRRKAGDASLALCDNVDLFLCQNVDAINRRNLEVERNKFFHVHSCIFVDFQGLSQELFGHWVDVELVDNTVSAL